MRATLPIPALPILALAVLAQTAAGDLVHVSSERVLRARGLDGTGTEVFKSELVRTDTGDWQEELEAFGFVGPNFLAGSTTQRSNMDPVLTPVVPNSLMLFQGSAALAGNISTTDPLRAEAISSVRYTFSTDVAATIRIIWSLEARGEPNLGRSEIGPTTMRLRQGDGSFPSPILLSKWANPGDIVTGFTTILLDAGTYTLETGVWAKLYQGPDPMFPDTYRSLPEAPEQSGAYTVTLALLPSPGSVAALALGGLLISRRRR